MAAIEHLLMYSSVAGLRILQALLAYSLGFRLLPTSATCVLVVPKASVQCPKTCVPDMAPNLAEQSQLFHNSRSDPFCRHVTLY